MKPHYLILALVLAGATPGAAQQRVVPAEKVLSPAQEQAQKGIMLLRDSVLGAQSALRQLERDYQQAAPRTLESWARQIADQCAGAQRTVPVSRALVSAAEFVQREMVKGQQDMIKAIDRTNVTLGECQTTFAPLASEGKGEEVRVRQPPRVPLRT
jgi:exonuclease VII large subunit